jgi:hypothetical protein
MSYRLETSVRVLVALCGFCGAVFAPWWVPLVCMVLLSLRYAAWEVPLIGLCMDLLWLPGTGHMMLPVFTLFGVALVWLLAPLRQQFLL